MTLFSWWIAKRIRGRILNIEMKKAAWIMIFALPLVGCDGDAAPEGEGSIVAGERMLEEISKVSVGTVPPGYTRFNFDDGSWIAIKGIDSHGGPDGGTVGLVTNEGESAIFFTHVCGPGATPLEGIVPSAESASMALDRMRATKKEYRP